MPLVLADHDRVGVVGSDELGHDGTRARARVLHQSSIQQFKNIGPFTVATEMAAAGSSVAWGSSNWRV